MEATCVYSKLIKGGLITLLGGIPYYSTNKANVTEKDLNTVTDAGVYYSDGSTSWTNGPTTTVNSSTRLIVIQSGKTGRIQIILCLSPNAQEIHYRSFNVGDTTAYWYKA